SAADRDRAFRRLHRACDGAADQRRERPAHREADRGRVGLDGGARTTNRSRRAGRHGAVAMTEVSGVAPVLLSDGVIGLRRPEPVDGPYYSRMRNDLSLVSAVMGFRLGVSAQ